LEPSENITNRPEWHTARRFETVFLYLNCQRPELSDARVRRALAIALSRSLIVNKIKRGSAQPAYGFVPPTLYRQLRPAIIQDGDLDGGPRLMKEAGLADGAPLRVL